MIVEIILFVILPAGLTVLLGWRGLVLTREAEIRHQSLEMGQVARRIVARAGAAELVRQSFLQGTPPPWPLPARISVADRDSSDQTARKLGELEAIVIDAKPLEDQDSEPWKKIFGIGFSLETLRRRPGEPVRVLFGKREAWLIWERGPDVGRKSRLWLAIVPESGWRLRHSFLERRKAAGNRPAGVAIDRSNHRWLGDGRQALDRARKIWAERRIAGLRGRVLDGRVCYLERLDDGQLLYLEDSLSSWALFADSHAGLPVFGGLMFLGAVLYFSFRQRFFVGSLRMTLMGMFGYVVGLPLAGVAVLALGVLADRSTIRLQEVTQEARNALMRFDDSFREEESRTGRYFRRLSRHPDLARGNLAGFEATMDSFFRKGLLARAEAWSWDKRPWYKRDEVRDDHGYDRLSSLVAEYSIVEIGEREAGRPPSGRSPALVVLQDVLEAPLFGFSEMLRKPDQLQSFRSGQSFNFWFWHLDRKGKTPVAYLSFTRSHESAVRSHLERGLVRNREFHLVARDRRSGRWFGLAAPGRILRDLVDAVSRTGEEQIGQVRVRSEPYLVIGMAGTKLEKVDLLALIPEGRWKDDLEEWKRRVTIGIGLALFLGVISAWLLAGGLLRPISDLSLGIQALRKRESRHRIPVRSQDELGRMSQAFNLMLENVSEMSIAREVQETLLPRETPSPVGYDSGLRITMCSSLGGDYADLLQFSGGRYGFMIGDVSGHGVSAALVVAMTKAAVFRYQAEGLEPVALLTELNLTLFEIARPQMMSCLMGVLDPSTHRLQIFLAGHPYPLIMRRKTGAAELIGRANYPLGVRRKLKFDPIELQLEAGDAVLAYTDGLVEALAPDGLPFGYDRLVACFSEASRAEPHACKVMEFIERRFRDYLDGGSPADDVSQFLLMRLPNDSQPPLEGGAS